MTMTTMRRRRRKKKKSSRRTRRTKRKTRRRCPTAGGRTWPGASSGCGTCPAARRGMSWNGGDGGEGRGEKGRGGEGRGGDVMGWVGWGRKGEGGDAMRRDETPSEPRVEIAHYHTRRHNRQPPTFMSTVDLSSKSVSESAMSAHGVTRTTSPFLLTPFCCLGALLTYGSERANVRACVAVRRDQRHPWTRQRQRHDKDKTKTRQRHADTTQLTACQSCKLS